MIVREKSDYPILVKEIRKQLSLSQEDLARQLGVSYATVNRWENRQTKPSPLALKQIEVLIRAMGESARDLLETYFDSESC